MKPQNACLPFQEYSTATLRSKSKKVFSHYFSPFPVSVDNMPMASDDYAQYYLHAFGEGSKFLAGGGFLRARPLGTSPLSNDTYVKENLKKEVRRASAMGIDGFSFDVLATDGELWDVLIALLDAAKEVDPTFKIMMMPDMTSMSSSALDKVVTTFNNHPSAYRTDDGKLVMSPFYADAQTPSWWSSKLAGYKNQGINITFVPLFLSLPSSLMSSFKSVSNGFGDWGPRGEDSGASMIDNGAAVHQYGSIYFAPVAPNDVRPKDLNFQESHNSGSFRNLWMSAINGGADWVQLITWNDYSEHTHVSPSLGLKGEMQRTYYDLSAFYTTWFKMGAQPAITNEMLYYFHRRQNMNLQPASKAKQTGTFGEMYNGTVNNDIEVVAFLKSPGTIEVTAGGTVRTMAANAGITVFRTPIATGKPSFRLVRNGTAVISFQSQTNVDSSIEVTDPTYQSGSASASGTCYTFPEP